MFHCLDAYCISHVKRITFYNHNLMMVEVGIESEGAERTIMMAVRANQIMSVGVALVVGDGKVQGGGVVQGSAMVQSRYETTVVG